MATSTFKKYRWILISGVLGLGAIAVWIATAIFNAASQNGEEAVEAISLSAPRMADELYFLTLDTIELEYDQYEEVPLSNQPILKETLEQAFNLVTAGEYRTALERFQETETRLRVPSIRNNIGVLHTVLGNYDSAQEAYRLVFELDPNYPGTYFNFGLLLDAQRRWEEAVRYFDRSTLEASRERLNILTAELEKDAHEQELEPNENPNRATPIVLDELIDGAIENLDDQDFYSFEMPETQRDVVQVRFENNAPQMEATLRFLDAEKKYLTMLQTENTGENLDYAFSGIPGAVYYIHVFTNSFLREGLGNYRLSVTPMSAYDEYEPNDDIFDASRITIAQSIEAGIMDEDDQDFYYFSTPDEAQNIRVLVENRSSTLWPSFNLFDERKNLIEQQQANNREADVELTYSIEPNSDYFVQILGMNGYTQGPYTLTVTLEEE
ncbi:MAG: hypothetical protein AAFR31_15855 [Cyanobacteria bacterium J06627_8]